MDNSLFVHHVSNTLAIIIIYIDDILIISNNFVYIDSLLTVLHNQFAMRNLGQLNHFLGIEFKNHPLGVILSQEKYALTVLEKEGMLTCKPAPTPILHTSLFHYYMIRCFQIPNFIEV